MFFEWCAIRLPRLVSRHFILSVEFQDGENRNLHALVYILRSKLFINLPFLFRLLVECFTKYDLLNEAVRHFRALARHPGATTFLYNEGHGRETDPLSLYLRALCLEGTRTFIVSGRCNFEREENKNDR
jgi:hypothetical protein